MELCCVCARSSAMIKWQRTRKYSPRKNTNKALFAFSVWENKCCILFLSITTLRIAAVCSSTKNNARSFLKCLLFFALFTFSLREGSFMTTLWPKCLQYDQKVSFNYSRGQIKIANAQKVYSFHKCIHCSNFHYH